MGLGRTVFLTASNSRFLRERAPRMRFVRRAVTRFMPGEDAEDGLRAAGEMWRAGVPTVFTELGENVSARPEAEAVAAHYIALYPQIMALRLPATVSVKLTQLGLDFDPEFCYASVARIIEASAAGAQAAGQTPPIVWIDMEASGYVDATLNLYRRARRAFSNVGVCLQAYLHRTAADVEALLPLGPAIRLVKGAYQEPPTVAFRDKADVDKNYYQLTTRMLAADARAAGLQLAAATHDRAMIARICAYALEQNLKTAFEFQMLYGIQRGEQIRLAREGWRSTVLIAYGSYWFPWYMRRLAERPANVTFLLRNLF
ncbi:MAG: proline dehydrogenase family protein [Terriglobales bacterium]